MDVEIICPLGSKCEEAKDSKLLRCGWYTELTGVKPDGTSYTEKACAMAFMPVLMTENAQQIRGMTAATESFRNENVKGMNQFNKILGAAVSQSKKSLE